MAEQLTTGGNAAGFSMDQWAAAVEKFNPGLARSLKDDRLGSGRRVAELGLPQYREAYGALTSFLTDPALFLGNIATEQVYIGLIPNQAGAGSGFQRVRTIGVPKSGIEAFISNPNPAGEKDPTKVGYPAINNADKFDIRIVEYEENVYGGVTVVNKDGTKLLEASKQGLTFITNGWVVPEFSVFQDYTRVHKYSFEDEQLRRKFFNVMKLSELPGYYEWVLAGQDLNLYFIDYLSNPIYQIK